MGKLGLVGEKNATGDSQKKLDVFANDTVVEAFAQTGLVAGIVSEELDEVKEISCEGKLRLLYECAPLASLVEAAGGRASTGRQRMLEVPAQSVHQRVPLVIGSAEDVALYESFLAASDR